MNVLKLVLGKTFPSFSEVDAEAEGVGALELTLIKGLGFKALG